MLKKAGVHVLRFEEPTPVVLPVVSTGRMVVIYEQRKQPTAATAAMIKARC